MTQDVAAVMALKDTEPLALMLDPPAQKLVRSIRPSPWLQSDRSEYVRYQEINGPDGITEQMIKKKGPKLIFFEP